MKWIFLLLASYPAFADQFFVRPFAGSDNIGDGGPAKLALLQQAEGLTSDAAGNLYIAEAAGHRIRRVTPTGQISTYADSLGAPYGIAMSPTGDLYVADLEKSCVWKINPTSRQVLAIPGLKTPRNVTLDAAGILYVSDFSSGRIIRADTGAPVAQGLNGASGLAFDRDGNLYIAESGAHAVRKLAKSGALTTVAQSLGTPTGIAIRDSTVYVADAPAGVIWVLGAPPIQVTARDLAFANSTLFASDRTVVRQINAFGGATEFAGSAQPYLGDGGPALQARLDHPSGIGLDATGNLYIADTAHHIVRRVDKDGRITTVAGTGQDGDSTDGAFAIDTPFRSPESVAADNAGNIYIADSATGKVRKIDRAGRASTVLNNLDHPVYVIAASDGSLYVSEKSRVSRFIAGKSEVLLNNLVDPHGLALDPGGNLYIALTGQARVIKREPSGRTSDIEGPWVIPRAITLFNGEIIVADTGLQSIVRNGSKIVAGLNFPWDLAASADQLYVAELSADRVSRLVERIGRPHSR